MLISKRLQGIPNCNNGRNDASSESKVRYGFEMFPDLCSGRRDKSTGERCDGEAKGWLVGIRRTATLHGSTDHIHLSRMTRLQLVLRHALPLTLRASYGLGLRSLLLLLLSRRVLAASTRCSAPIVISSLIVIMIVVVVVVAPIGRIQTCQQSVSSCLSFVCASASLAIVACDALQPG